MGKSWNRVRVASGVATVGILALSSQLASAAVVATLNFESAPVNAISALAGGGDIGFTGSSVNTGAATFGASDVTPKVSNSAVGSTQFQAANVGKVGNNYYGWAPHITSGALTNRTDTLTLDPVTFTAGSTNRTVSFNMLVTATTYEPADASNTQDFVKVIATINGTPTTLLDSTTLTNADIDNATVATNGYAPDGVYHTLTFNIPNNANNVVLSFTGAMNSSGGAEGLAFDNIVFSQTLVPEPASLGLSVVALSLLARRNRRA
jgi:hypothetical protein